MRNSSDHARTDEYEDLVAAGVIDPTKVTRTALQNAASIAGLLLTTEAVVTGEARVQGRRPGHAGRRRRHGGHVLSRSGRKPERIR